MSEFRTPIVWSALVAVALMFCIGVGWAVNGPAWSCNDRIVVRDQTGHFGCTHSRQKLTREGDDWVCRCAP